MDLQIADKIALVTGASQGIGCAIARLLAAEGVRVVLSARKQDTLDQATAEIRSAGGEAVAVVADVSQAEPIASLFEQTRSLVGEPDILVVNAGGPPPGQAIDLDEAAWSQGYDLTLMSAVRLAKAAIPAMQAKQWGRIINITSVSVKEPIANLALSNAFRAAVTGFAKTLSTEVAPYGITVNNVAPGFTATQRLNQLYQDEATRADLTQTIPAQRFATPEEVAAVAVFLASQPAAYVTGQTILVDGGRSKSVF